MSLPPSKRKHANVFSTQVKTWYPRLAKPWFTPPGWLFPVAWTGLYSAMGVASWLVFQNGGLAANALPLGLYALQLGANFAWTPLFFGAHRLDLALVDILAMDASILGCILTFRRASPLASNLMIPYLASSECPPGLLSSPCG